MKVLSSIVAVLLLATTAMADRKSADEKNLRTKKNKKLACLTDDDKKFVCLVDEDCPQIRCLRDPCPAIVCRSGSCFADNILAEAEEEPEPDIIEEWKCKSRLDCPQVS